MSHTIKSKLRKVNLYDDLDEIKSALSDTAFDLKAKAGDLLYDSYQNVADKSENVKENIASYTAEKPYSALGIALIAGITVGYLLKK